MMDITTLSSNWKALKQKLREEKSQKEPAPPLNSKKRKRTDLMPDSQPDRKKPRPRSKSLHAAPTVSPSTATESPERPSTSHSNRPAAPPADQPGVSPSAFAGKYVALDCEMVGFGPTPDKDSQLARASLVNYHGERLYDAYVQPSLPVTDHRTAFSGVRAADLLPSAGALPFREVQADVAAFLRNRVLVGHYLKADLHVLGLAHPRTDVRDTAWLPKFREAAGGRAPRLKDLAERVLGLSIQAGEHDSVEDARAAMMLYRAEKEAFESEARRRKAPRVAQTLSKFSAGKKLRKKKRK
jgi:RNA exonuclease 4